VNAAKPVVTKVAGFQVTTSAHFCAIAKGWSLLMMSPAENEFSTLRAE